MQYDPALRDLTAPYILSVISDLERNHHHFYTVLLRSPQETLSINLVYDYRAEPDRQDSTGDPIRTYSVREFLSRADTFHENDCFTIGMGQGVIVVGCEEEFNSEVIQCLLTEELRQHCRLSLFADKILAVGEMEGVSAEDLAAINKLVKDLNTEIISDLQIQYNVLRKLSFIKK